MYIQATCRSLRHIARLARPVQASRFPWCERRSDREMFYVPSCVTCGTFPKFSHPVGLVRSEVRIHELVVLEMGWLVRGSLDGTPSSNRAEETSSHEGGPVLIECAICCHASPVKLPLYAGRSCSEHCTALSWLLEESS